MFVRGAPKRWAHVGSRPVVKELMIFGTGGNCVDILDAVLAINSSGRAPGYDFKGFLDDDRQSWGKAVAGYPVLGPLSMAKDHPNCVFVNGIGSFRNYWRKSAIISTAGVPLDRFETIVHPAASVSRFATLGAGTVVLQNVTINSRARIGNHVIILPNAVISHDVIVGDYTCVASAACIAGNVRVGNACYLGANCSILNDLQLGDGSLVGMGAVLLEDVPSATVVVGNPARAIRSIC
jgi:sugar O-acyltransferase (sialic acid O-acetyltransferase NeuD family)